MTAEKAIRKVYKILDKVTPLKTDCGLLCSGECCKGDGETGMLLFPGEEVFYKNVDGFTVKKSTDGRNILVCSGRCDRKLRPVSCRIFPLVPVIVDGRIYVIDDPRAKGVCPLLYDEMPLSRKFEKRVAKAGKILTSDEEIYEFLIKLTDEISDVISMKQDIFG